MKVNSNQLVNRKQYIHRERPLKLLFPYNSVYYIILVEMEALAPQAICGPIDDKKVLIPCPYYWWTN